MRHRPGLIPALAVLVFHSAVLGAENVQPAETLFLERFESFRQLGYDPLTVPVEWFRPIESIAGAGGNPSVDPAAAAASERSVSGSALIAAAAYAEQAEAIALLVWHDGALQYERYWHGMGRDSYFNPQSMSKTVLGMMIGIAIRDGHIASVDDRADRYLPEWLSDPRGEITLRQLLQMSSGLAQISTSYEVTLDNPAVYHHFGTDFVGPILALELADVPGTKWDYNNNETNLLGVILERASGRRYSDYLSDALWQPAGLADAKLYMDRPGGTPMFSCCILSRPIDWLKLGILFLNKGSREDKQIVPAEWIEAMLRPAPTTERYGYQVWLGDDVVASEPPAEPQAVQGYASEPYDDPDIVTLRGFGYQRVWIMPSKRLIVMKAGRSWPAAWDNAVIPNTIYRGTP